jgi:hypothetical protein
VFAELLNLPPPSNKYGSQFAAMEKRGLVVIPVGLLRYESPLPFVRRMWQLNGEAGNIKRLPAAEPRILVPCPNQGEVVMTRAMQAGTNLRRWAFWYGEGSAKQFGVLRDGADVLGSQTGWLDAGRFWLARRLHLAAMAGPLARNIATGCGMKPPIWQPTRFTRVGFFHVL